MRITKIRFPFRGRTPFSFIILLHLDEGEYDLHEAYTKLDGSTVTPHIKIPWKQIDYNLLTPWQIKHDRVPGTFEPPKLSKRR